MIDLRPMMAVSVGDPFDHPGWAFEPKWDGVRAIVHGAEAGVTLISRNGNDVTAAYPEARAVAHTMPAGTVLDGEVVAFDGRPSFGRLQSRMHVRDVRRVRHLTVTIPPGRQCAKEKPRIRPVSERVSGGRQTARLLPR